jgi:chorismate synthase
MMHYTLFGTSHGPAVGVLIEDVPAGITLDMPAIAEDLRRRSGGGALTTARHEADAVEVLSGVFEGRTTGEPVCLLLRNGDVRSADYEALKNIARPGHADYTAFVASRGFNDPRGGGSFSGRLTAPLVAAGAVAKQVLKEQYIVVKAQVVDENDLRERAEAAKAAGDSVGGQIHCTVTGVPAGVGGNDWQHTVESEIARHVFAIPAVKAIGFGAGESFAAMRGSEGNDEFYYEEGAVKTRTNHAGGINGGITNGMPIDFTVTFRPTPSIAKEQETVNFKAGEHVTLSVPGRHDACIVLRASPAVEAAAALALCQLIDCRSEPLSAKCLSAKNLPACRREIDRLDGELTRLFEKRLELVSAIGHLKQKTNRPIRDTEREEEVLDKTRHALSDPGWRDQTRELFEKIMEISRRTEM